MWVGGNEEIAKNAVGSVVDHLEHNEKLIEIFVVQVKHLNPKQDLVSLGHQDNLL